MTPHEFHVGDEVQVKPEHRHGRTGVILALPDFSRFNQPECYKIRFSSGAKYFLTKKEISPLSVVDKLAKLADDEA